MRRAAVALTAAVLAGLGLPFAQAGLEAPDPPGVIRTIAGLGDGDGRPATDVRLNYPRAVEAGPDGTLYVADQHRETVRVVRPDGIIDHVAGTRMPGFNGDGGPARYASLYKPTSVAAGPDGSILVADSMNHRVRRIGPDGVMSTVAGNGTPGSLGDGGPATSASLTLPLDVAVGSDGSIYVADAGAARIRRIDPTGTITTVAGNGVHGYTGDGLPATLASLAKPSAVDVGADGSIYIADTENNRIRRVDPEGIISTFAGNGIPRNTPLYEVRTPDSGKPADQVWLSRPLDVEITPAGELVIADTGNHKIRLVDVQGVMHDVAGVGWSGWSHDGARARDAELYVPTEVTLTTEGRLVFVESGVGRVRMIDDDGRLRTVAGGGRATGNGDGGPAEDAPPLRYPRFVHTDAVGHIYVAEAFADRVRMIAPDGTITTVAGGGSCGEGIGDGGPATAACLDFPYSALPAPDGSVYVSEYSGNRIRRIDPQGVISTVAGTGAAGYSPDGTTATEAELERPMDMAISPAGELHFVVTAHNIVRKIDSEGAVVTVAGGGFLSGPVAGGRPAVDAKFVDLEGLAFDPDGDLYVSDWAGNAVWRVDNTGTLHAFAGTGAPGSAGDGGPATLASLFHPTGLAVAADGSVIIADMGNGLVRRVSPAGTIDTVAGTPAAVTTGGDGGPAREAGMVYPSGVALTPQGDLLIGDYGNGLLRRVKGPLW